MLPQFIEHGRRVRGSNIHLLTIKFEAILPSACCLSGSMNATKGGGKSLLGAIVALIQILWEPKRSESKSRNYLTTMSVVTKIIIDIYATNTEVKSILSCGCGCGSSSPSTSLRMLSAKLSLFFSAAMILLHLNK